MWLGEPGTVEVRLDRNVLDEYFGRTDPATGASVIETLSLSLYGTSDAFEIERLSERTQFVGGNSVVPEGLDRWAWHVTPRDLGTQDLVVRVSALLLDRHGVPAPVALPDRRFRVDVDAREGGRVMSSLSGWLRPLAAPIVPRPIGRDVKSAAQKSSDRHVEDMPPACASYRAGRESAAQKRKKARQPAGPAPLNLRRVGFSRAFPRRSPSSPDCRTRLRDTSGARCDSRCSSCAPTHRRQGSAASRASADFRRSPS